jgi:predicted aspartyl protease
MGRITTTVRIGSFFEPGHEIVCAALVDTGAYCLTLPRSWKERLGPLPIQQDVDLELADRSPVRGEICGPVRIRIDGFREFAGEVLFVDADPSGSDFEPLIGYLTLEGAGVVVDMVGHRLVALKVFDLKSASASAAHTALSRRCSSPQPISS